MKRDHHAKETTFDEEMGYTKSQHSPQRMSTWMVTFITFVAVCGTGPFTSEILVKVAHPFLGILGLFVVPWFIGAPSAMTCAELSSAMPDNRGYLLWLQKAFGYFWGFQQGVLQAICGIIDLAIYPALFTEYLSELIPMSETAMRVVQVLIIVTGVTVDILGVEWIGNLSIVVSAIVLFPFLVIFLIGLPQATPSQWFLMPPGSLVSLDWGLFITIIAFKFTGFDTISHFAGEMKNPEQFFRAMGTALFLAIASRVLPMLVVVCIDKDYEKYNEGYYTVLADQVGGVILSSMVVFSAAVGCFVTYVTYLYSCAVTLYTLAAKDYLDIEVLYKMSKNETPWLSIIVIAGSSLLFSVLSFEELVKISGSLYQICLLMQYAALVKLRISKPKLPRPNKIPFTTSGLIAFLFIPSCISLFLLYSTISHSLSSFLVLMGSIIFSVSLYFAKQTWSKKSE